MEEDRELIVYPADEDQDCLFTFLPFEVTIVILPSRNSLAGEVIICRMVCRAWRNLLDPPTTRNSNKRVKNNYIEPPHQKRYSRNCTFCDGVASLGWFTVLKWGIVQGAPWYTQTMAHAAFSGNLEMLVWLVKEEGGSAFWDGSLVASAARRGNLEVLRWLKDAGAPGSVMAVRGAAQEGNIEVLEWLFRNYPNQSELVTALEGAAERGQEVVLRWSETKGLHEVTSSSPCAAAAKAGCLDALKWLEERGLPLDADTYYNAALGGDLGVFLWVGNYLANKTIRSYDNKLWDYAAQGGCTEVLLALHERCGTPPHRVCENAAVEGHLEALQFLLELGATCEESVCAMAALGGHLDILMWLRDRGVPWDASTCAYAAKGGHLDLLRWCLDNGAPIDQNIYGAALDDTVLSWLEKNTSVPPPQLQHIPIQWRRDTAEYDRTKQGPVEVGTCSACIVS